MNFTELKREVVKICNEKTDNSPAEILTALCHLLRNHVDHYDWVGFYFKDKTRNVLTLGSFAGEDTEHKTIPFGKGICGQVALSNKTFVVPDVSKQNNYIACSISVKSEIVLPIFVNGDNVGQIDIDSNTLDPFTDRDERFLEFVCQEVSSIAHKIVRSTDSTPEG